MNLTSTAKDASKKHQIKSLLFFLLSFFFALGLVTKPPYRMPPLYSYNRLHGYATRCLLQNWIQVTTQRLHTSGEHDLFQLFHPTAKTMSPDGFNIFHQMCLCIKNKKIKMVRAFATVSLCITVHNAAKQAEELQHSWGNVKNRSRMLE